MGTRNQAQGRGARLSNPVLALLIAAVAAIGAIAQCGSLLDAASAGQGAERATVQSVSPAPVKPTERPHLAAAQRAVPSPGAGRPN